MLYTQKFLRVKYFPGKIFKGLNFCGTGHPQIFNPLKIKWKWTRTTRQLYSTKSTLPMWMPHLQGIMESYNW